MIADIIAGSVLTLAVIVGAMAVLNIDVLRACIVALLVWCAVAATLGYAGWRDATPRAVERPR